MDDAAVIEIGGETLVVTHDAMAEGSHFRAEADMADVAWKLVASNLSDLAAKGAKPTGALLSYSLGSDDERFLTGLREALEEFDLPLLGGDTIAVSGPRTISLTAIGLATHTPVRQRSGACVGDAIYVTGTVGCAMLGFEGDHAHLEAFNRPRPLLEKGYLLAPCVHAMMDVSDGLLLDSWRMARASEATFDLNSETVPVADRSRRDECLRWGDDYQLLFTLPHDQPPPIAATRIGSVIARGPAPLLLDAMPMNDADSLGYTHR